MSSVNLGKVAILQPHTTDTPTYKCLQEPLAGLCVLPGLLRALTVALSTKEFSSSDALYPEAK